MTKEMQELIDRELNAALESGDAKLGVTVTNIVRTIGTNKGSGK